MHITLEPNNSFSFATNPHLREALVIDTDKASHEEKPSWEYIKTKIGAAAVHRDIDRLSNGFWTVLSDILTDKPSWLELSQYGDLIQCVSQREHEYASTVLNAAMNIHKPIAVKCADDVFIQFSDERYLESVINSVWGGWRRASIFTPTQDSGRTYNVDMPALQKFFTSSYVRHLPIKLVTNPYSKQASEVPSEDYTKPKAPWSNDPHVGIELEFGHYDTAESHSIGKALQSKGLSKHVWLHHDAGHEASIIIPEKDLDDVLPRIFDIIRAFNPELRPAAQSLHVHLDTRHRNREVVFHNMVVCQYLINSFVGPARFNMRRSTYIPMYDLLLYGIYGKWRGNINPITKGTNTIEVRSHGCTLNTDRALRYIKMLIHIAQHPNKLYVAGNRFTRAARIQELCIPTDLLTYYDTKEDK